MEHRKAMMTADVQDSRAKPLYTDIAAMLDGTLPEPPQPCVLCRSDGRALFYKGEVNLVFGDPEHGKTWVILAGCAEVLTDGGRVIYVDLDHNGAAAIVSRLVLLGVPSEILRVHDRFRHCEPTEVAAMEQMVADCQQWLPDIAVIDSTGELIPLFGGSSDNADDFTDVHNHVLQPLANTGAAMLLADHPAKQHESRKIGPGGSMAKRRTVGGSSIRVVRVRPFTKRDGGKAKLWVNKDRHGGLRDHCPPPAPGKEEQLAGTFVLGVKGADGLAPWQVLAEPLDGTAAPFRPTTLMERVSRAVEERPGQLNKTAAAEGARGKKTWALQAVDILDDEGYLSKSTDPTPLYDSVKDTNLTRPHPRRGTENERNTSMTTTNGYHGRDPHR
jgi:hypothetical protein